MYVYIHLDRKRLHSMSCLSNEEKWSCHSDNDKHDRYDVRWYDMRWCEVMIHDLIHGMIHDLIRWDVIWCYMMWLSWIDVYFNNKYLYVSLWSLVLQYSHITNITILMLTHHHVISYLLMIQSNQHCLIRAPISHLLLIHPWLESLHHAQKLAWYADWRLLHI